MARPSPSDGISPATIALLLVVTVVAAAAGLMFLVATEQDAPASPGASGPPVEEADPFEGLPPETPPGK